MKNEINLKEIKNTLSELPQQRRERFKKEYNLLDKEIEVFVQNKNLSEYFEKVMSELRNWLKEKEIKKKVSENEFLKLAKLATSYLITDLQGLLKGISVSDKNFKITPENFAELIALIYKKEISSKIAKMVLTEMYQTDADPSHIIQEKGLSQITDEQEIGKFVQEVISQNKKVAQDFKQGKTNAIQFLIGQVMAKTKGQANPETVSKLLRKNL